MNNIHVRGKAVVLMNEQKMIHAHPFLIVVVVGAMAMQLAVRGGFRWPAMGGRWMKTVKVWSIPDVQHGLSGGQNLFLVAATLLNHTFVNVGQFFLVF